MVILRRTSKLQAQLPETDIQSGHSDTALGDWYVNRVSIGTIPLLLLVSSDSFLPLVTAAREVSTLPARLPRLVGDRLARLGVPVHYIRAELDAMDPVVTAKTIDRRVIGMLVEFSKMAPDFYRGIGSNVDHALYALERDLERTPCLAKTRDSFRPNARAMELLESRWSAA